MKNSTIRQFQQALISVVQYKEFADIPFEVKRMAFASILKDIESVVEEEIKKELEEEQAAAEVPQSEESIDNNSEKGE